MVTRIFSDISLPPLYCTTDPESMQVSSVKTVQMPMSPKHLSIVTGFFTFYTGIACNSDGVKVRFGPVGDTSRGSRHGPGEAETHLGSGIIHLERSWKIGS